MYGLSTLGFGAVSPVVFALTNSVPDKTEVTAQADEYFKNFLLLTGEFTSPPFCFAVKGDKRDATFFRLH
jgi:hypothetical protein